MVKKRLGELLREQGKLRQADLDAALSEQETCSERLGEILFRRGFVAKNALIAALQATARLLYLEPRTVPDPALLACLPRELALQHCAIPMYRQGKRVVVVLAEPQNQQTILELSSLLGAEISPRLAFRAEIEEAIGKWYGPQAEVAEAPQKDAAHPFIESADDADIEFASVSSSERAQAAMEEIQAELRKERTPCVRLVAAVWVAGWQKGARDIYVEPQPVGALVRVRLDGMMRELTHVTPELVMSLVSRIKILSDMDISERRQPQDGRFLARISGRRLDLRVSTLPTQYGEKVVMRLLDPSAALVSFERLGFSDFHASTLKRTLALPQGMLLVTGPTGSGKSTTLYTFLNTLRNPEVNVITVEDPVEYKIEDVNQVQVNVKAGLTFSSCLRSILRQDPNVIMVGEVRDAETAEIALQAAQTGHFVLSTLHTNDSVGAVTRLFDLGIPGFLIASSITAVVAQRLVRRLCTCALQAPASADYLARLRDAGVADIPKTMHVPGRCATCDQTGYRGRVGIYELLVFDDQIRASVRSGARDEEIRDLARAGDMRTMQEDALEKVARGLTTLDEAQRVVPFENSLMTRCKQCSKTLAASFTYCPYCGESVRSGPASMRPAWVRTGGR